ncbi:MAG: hypothetical protein ACTHK7_00230, partial [Aureliella sp.]
LGLELSAVVMERIALAGVNYEGAPLVTPGTLWENYLKLNQSARIEAYPVLAGDFVKQVKDAPSDAEIRQLYDAGAANFPSPNSPQPGFRRRYQANVEYVSGSWNKLLEVEKAKIGEEALRAEYDRLVGLGGLQVPVESPQPGKEAAPGETKPGDAKPNEEKPSEEKPSEQKPDEAKSSEGKQAEQPTDGQPPAPKAEGDKAEGDKAEGDKAQQDKSESKKEDEAKSGGDQPANDASDKDQADLKSQSRAVGRDGQIRLVAFQQEGDDEKSDGEKSDDEKSDKKSDKKSEDKKSDDKQSDEKPADAQSSDAPPPVENPPSPENLNASAATKPAADSAKSPAPAAKDGEAKAEEAKPEEAKPEEAKPSEAQPDAAQAAAGAAAPAAAGAGNTPMRTQTFEEARDSLARTLAMSVVRDQLQAKLQKIESAMNAYRTKKQMERLNAEAGRKSAGEPAKIDLKKLAEEEGLTYGSTGMIDGFRLASTPIGRSMIGNQALANTVMTPEVELFTPVRSMFIEMENPTEPDFQEFVSWKIDAVPAYTPELNDIRDEVIEAWKTQRARVLAEEEARKLADKLKSAGDEPWKSVLDAQKQTLVVNPPPFTWMSPPREMFAAAQISFVQGLDTVGQDFMQRVFATRPGQVTVAPNQGLNTYYVVRVLELTPTADQLRQNFEISRGRARQLAFPERERMFADWYDTIERKLNVQWMAAPETLMN